MEVSEVVMGVPPKHPSLGFSMKPAIKGYPHGDSFPWPGEIKVISQAGTRRDSVMVNRF